MNQTIEELLNQYEKWIHKLIKKYKYITVCTSYEYDDLYQEAVVAFIEAYYKFDESKGNKFITYASTAINNRLALFAVQKTNYVKTPYEYTKIWNTMTSNNLTTKDIDEVVKLSGYPTKKVVQALQWYEAKQMQSLDEIIPNDEGNNVSKHDFTAKRYDDLSKIFVNEFLETLDPNAKAVLVLRMDEYQQNEICEIKNISRRTVNYAMNRARNQFRVFTIGGNRGV